MTNNTLKQKKISLQITHILSITTIFTTSILLTSCGDGNEGGNVTCTPISSKSIPEIEKNYKNIIEKRAGTTTNFFTKKGLESYGVGAFLKNGSLQHEPLQGTLAGQTNTSSAFSDYEYKFQSSTHISTSSAELSILALPSGSIYAANKNASGTSIETIDYHFIFSNIKETHLASPNNYISANGTSAPSANQLVYGIYKANITLILKLYDKCGNNIKNSSVGYVPSSLLGMEEFKGASIEETNEGIKITSPEPIVIAYLIKPITSLSKKANIGFKMKKETTLLLSTSKDKGEEKIAYLSYKEGINIEDSNTYTQKIAFSSSKLETNLNLGDKICSVIASNISEKITPITKESCFTNLGKDSIPPFQSFIEQDPINNNTFYISAIDDNGINAYALTKTDQAPEPNSSNWINVSLSQLFSKTITYSINTNEQVYIWFKDAWGNISASNHIITY